MKFIAVFFISFYQLFVSPLLHAATGTAHACRYPVTCSEYAKKQIQKKGVIKGGYLAIKRLLSCNPFAKPPLHNV